MIIIDKEDLIKWIDEQDYTTLLRHWRFDPIGSELFQEYIGEHYSNVMIHKGEELKNSERVKISKEIGWDCNNEV